MKTDQLDMLDTGKPTEPKFKTPKVHGRRFHGAPHLRLKKVRTSPRQKIRQLLRDSISMEEVRSLSKSLSRPENPTI
ncbi:hypothetical protein [Pedobacter jeongneungensis]|uniref:hypothetical protein n=1 Tax=Pedobacter jeongneungensis TaxID=947309 RepID=UPI0031CF108D